MNPRYLAQYFGEYGTVTLTSGTGSVSTEFAILEVMTDGTTFNLLSDRYASGATAAVSVTYDAGAILRGKFTLVNVATGAVRAYKSAPM